MTITTQQTTAIVVFQGRIYHFCTDRCRRKFEEHPDWYVQVRGPEDDPRSPARRA